MYKEKNIDYKVLIISYAYQIIKYDLSFTILVSNKLHIFFFFLSFKLFSKYRLTDTHKLICQPPGFSFRHTDIIHTFRGKTYHKIPNYETDQIQTFKRQFHRSKFSTNFTLEKIPQS